MYAVIVGNEPDIHAVWSRCKWINPTWFSLMERLAIAESVILTTDGTPWSLIETEGTGGVVIGVQTDTIEFQNTQSGVSVYRPEEVQTFNVVDRSHLCRGWKTRIRYRLLSSDRHRFRWSSRPLGLGFR